ncbi:MAG: ABC transporter permease [Vicinamibacteria bacterium]
MSRAAFRAMALSFVRDRGALAMSFLLPVAFFLVFAAIFANASGQNLRLKLALADEVRSEASSRLLEAVGADPSVLRVGGELDTDQVRDLVRRGTADVGLVMRRGGSPLGEMGGAGKPPLLLVLDPTRAVLADMTIGLVQRAYFRALPDVALAGVARLIEQELVTLNPDQKRQLAEGLEGLKPDPAHPSPEGAGGGIDEMFEREAIAGQSSGRNHVAYYAGAIAFLFLLFSAVHGATSLLEEREAGILDRILAGPGGTGALITGKFLFLVTQGCIQVTVIFVVAWLVHGVALPSHLGAYSIVTAAASLSAAGLALVLVSACRTRRQAQTFSNIAILLVSAVGGSMVPRFFMPPLLQRLGWATPNTWALEAYSAVFWRDEPVTALVVPVGMLFLSGALGYWAARRLAARGETL